METETLKNSIKPSIEETERFIFYLNKRFSLGIKDDLIVNIQETSKNAKGYFMPIQNAKHYETLKIDAQKRTETPYNSEIDTQPSKTTPLNLIVISSLYLNDSIENIMEVIAHELSHYINSINGHNSKGNYHTKEFKLIAERLLLKVEKGKYGYNLTTPTEEFKLMIEEYKPNKDAYKVFQNIKDAKRQKSRQLKYICGCGCIIRTAKNENKPLQANCLYCNTNFIREDEEKQDD